MTPKEKAKQLHADIYKIVSNGKASHNPYMGIEYIPDLWEIAKECALIAVDEKIEVLRDLGYDNDDDRIIYQLEVKQEIEKL
jgi:hypothetical protein